VRDLTVTTAKQGLNLRGYADDHITDVRLRDVDLGMTTRPDVAEYVDGLVLDHVLENGEPLVLDAPVR
jgi:hypothetical protein